MTLTINVPPHLQCWLFSVLAIDAGILLGALPETLETRVTLLVSNVGILWLASCVAWGKNANDDLLKLLDQGHQAWSIFLLWLLFRMGKGHLTDRTLVWAFRVLCLADLLAVWLEYRQKGAPTVGGAVSPPVGKTDLEKQEKKEDPASEELLQIHQKFSHMSFTKLQAMAKQGKLPQHLATCKVPVCSKCQSGKNHKKKRGKQATLR